MNPQIESIEDKPARTGAWLWLGTAAMFLVVYAATCQRGPAWQDSGIFQWRILNFDLTGKMGLALAHPLLILLGKTMTLLPIGGLAFRLNLVSAVCGAIAVANVALLVRGLAPDRPAAAWLAAGFFGLAHTPWWLATICESQMVFAAVFTTSLHAAVSFVRRPTPVLALVLGAVIGLGLLAHNLALLATVVYGLVVLALRVRGRVHWSALLLFVGGWVVGAGAYLAMTVRAATKIGLVPAVKSALFGQGWQGAVLGGSGRAVEMGCGYIAYNFPNAALLLALVGLVAVRRPGTRSLRWCLWGLVAIYLAFAIRYRVMDQFMFFVPFYAMVAVFAGVGLGGLKEATYRWVLPVATASVLIGPALYAAMPAIARATHLPVPGRKDLPFRDAGRYWLSPWKGAEDSAGQFARAALEETPAGGTIIADGTALYPLLWVQRVDGLGRGVDLVESPSESQFPPGQPNVFAVSRLPGYHPTWLDDRAALEKPPGHVLYRVVWNSPAATAPPRPATLSSPPAASQMKAPSD